MGGCTHPEARDQLAAVTALAVLPEGRLASAGVHGSVLVWDLAAGSAQLLEGHTYAVTALAVLPENRLASAGDDGTVRVWNFAAGSTRVREGQTDCVSRTGCCRLYRRRSPLAAFGVKEGAAARPYQSPALRCLAKQVRASRHRAN
jgi:hypothetical protein